jgi:hypothetical protein
MRRMMAENADFVIHGNGRSNLGHPPLLVEF